MKTPDQTPDYIQSSVAQDLVILGKPLEEICRVRGLNLKNWTKITQTPAFQHKLKELSKELQDRSLDRAADDPVRERIREECLESVETLVRIRDDDSAPYTAVRGCAKDILEMGGYAGAQHSTQNINAISIQIDESKLKRVMQDSPVIENFSDFVHKSDA